MAILGCCSASGVMAQLVSETARQRVQSRAVETAANPFLSFLPEGVEADFEAWQRFVDDLGSLRSGAMNRASLSLVSYAEVEAVGQVGLNDFDVSAEWLPRRDGAEGWRIDGRLDRPPEDLTPVGDIGGSTVEGLDIGALLVGGARLFAQATIGDGSHGSAGSGRGDFDVFCFDGLAGQSLVASATTPPPGASGAGLDVFLALLDGDGVAVAFEDEIIEGGFFVSTDARMEHRLALDDRYCLFVGGSRFDGLVLPADPSDASSGPGVISEGDYRLEVAVDPPDRFGRDLFAFSVEAGDVVGATVREGARHRLRLLGSAVGENPIELVSSSSDLSGLYPEPSPLPAGGRATVAYVMPRTQTAFLSVEAGSAFDLGTYGVELAIYRPPSNGAFRGARSEIQRVVLEFEGGEVDRSLFFGGVPDPEPVQLSPMVTFLPRWGLGPEDHDRLAGRIVDEVRDELAVRIAELGGNGDWRGSGVAGDFAVEVVGGGGAQAQPGDVRIIIGGSIDELRLQTIGIAETIDPGNFEKTKVAVVLLDLLSGPAGDRNSINSVENSPAVSRIDLIATAVGRIAAHEAGHLFGNFHTERDVGPTTIMDSGGRLDLLLGLGDDGVFGSEDDLSVHLGPDEYSRREPFGGVEPTLEVLSHGLPVGVAERVRVEPGRIDFGAVPLGSSLVRQIEFRNEGTRAQTMRPGTGGGCGLCPFGFSSSPFVLAAGERRLLDVTFGPLGAGPAGLELPIAVEPAAQPARTSVQLTGIGLGVGSSSILEGLPAEPTFPPVLYPGPSDSSAQVSLRNIGDVAVRPVARLQGPQADRFRVVGLSGRGLQQDLLPNDEVLLDVEFDPTGDVGEASASLWLLDSLRAASATEILLRARSDGPDVALEPRPYAFGALRADGASGRRSFRIENRGTRPLRVTSVVLGAATPAEYELTAPPTPRNVAPGATLFVPVVFAPSDAVVYRGELVVETNDPDEPRAIAEMLGLGLLPMIEVWPPAIRLGVLSPGESVSDIVLRVANAGGASLNGTVELVDPAGNWTLIPPPGALRLPPDSETEFVLSYTAPPARSPAAEAVLVIRSDDRDRPEVRIPLIVGSVLEIPAGGAVASVLLAMLLVVVTWHRLRY